MNWLKDLIVDGVRGDTFWAVFKWYLLHMLVFMPIWVGMRLYGFSFEQTIVVIGPLMFIIIMIECYIAAK